jgi:hypothetical protein
MELGSSSGGSGFIRLGGGGHMDEVDQGNDTVQVAEIGRT